VLEGLVPDKRRVLLGSSRTDIAALVLKVALGRLLRKSGRGYFFLPVSLFCGEDAHRGFRDYIANHRPFAVDELYEFRTSKVFEGIGTSYCCVSFQMDVLQRFPVRYFREHDDDWIEHSAVPLKMPSDQWRILEKDKSDRLVDTIDVHLSPSQKPRQGVNTCGSNAIFHFREKPTHLEEQFLYPLATKEVWRQSAKRPYKWILLPYDRDTARPLSWPDIEKNSGLEEYLLRFRSALEQRKGTLIRSAIGKGFWWSLLGIGPYSFAPYKVIWEAYGKDLFHPTILSEVDGQAWQANQAMQAFIPCWSESEAKRVCSALQHPGILTLLRQLNGDGKCNWAQPGKIKRILSFNSPSYQQETLFDSL
jgi:hypothetical protein